MHIDRFEGRSSLYTWLCSIGKNAWLKECKRRSQYIDCPYEELKLTDPVPTPEEAMVCREEGRLLRRAVLQLEEPYRDVLILHAFGGLKLKEIAALYGKSESWARVTCFRARKNIQEVLSREI